MSGKGFLKSILIKIASLFTVVFLGTGLLFLFASHYGAASDPVIQLVLFSLGTVFALIALISFNLSGGKTSRELKAASSIAHRLANGETGQSELDDSYFQDSELIRYLIDIDQYLKEKELITDRIAVGDLSSKVLLRSEADSFGRAFQNMIDKLHLLIETEDKRARLQRSIFKLLTEVKDVATGDLTVEADTTPEITGDIASSFNFMTSEFRSLIRQVKDVTIQVSSSAKAINDSAEQLANGSEAQASQVLLTTNAISNMAKQIQTVSKNASESASVASESVNTARYGTQAVQDNINAMNSIRNQVQQTAKRIKKLGERSQEISQITQLIDDLSERTSLLALNASLKAAAAGEAGLGFANVAEEVERLAERSNRLTQQISVLTQTILSETQEVVASMEETIHEVVVGSTLADKAGHALVEIERVSRTQADLVESIHQSAKEQAKSAEDISTAMENIATITEMVNVSTKRTADSARLLVGLSGDLHGSISTFKLPEESKRLRPKATQSIEIAIG